jgi:Glucose / Sorbosone dehydrogenase
MILLANLGEVIRAAGIVAALLVLLGAGSAQALTLEPVGSFDQPIYVTSDPGDAGRLLVAEREGTIQLVENGVASEFVDLSSVVDCNGECQSERGLMSIALSPDFQSSGRLYVFYANDLDGKLHVDELVSAGPGHDTASLATLEPLLEIEHPGFANHNGGQLQFGPEGNLFVSTGDGGGSNDPADNAQDPDSPLGKLLRVDPDDPGLPNSYETWASGLRNPFRFSFDRLSGDMVIGDVGQVAREEIDFAPSPFPGVAGGQGADYGWDCREGLLAGAGPSPTCALAPADAFTEPVFDYPHSPDPAFGGPDRCAVIGGYVVRDPGLGALFGRYVYSDLCSGVLRALKLPAGGFGPAGGDCSLGLQVNEPVSFGEDAAGQLYVIEQGGDVLRLEGLPPAGCPSLPSQPPQPRVEPQPKPTFIGITAQRRRVERGKTAVLTVWVSPCEGRKGDVVALQHDGRRNGSKFLSRACTARFLRRVHRNSAFAAITYQDGDYLSGSSRVLRVRVKPHQTSRPR